MMSDAVAAERTTRCTRKSWRSTVAAMATKRMPPIDRPLPADLTEAFAAMEVIERYRDPCIRSDHPITAAVIEACAANYSRCVAAASRIVFGGARP